MKNFLILTLLLFPILFTNCGPDSIIKPTPEPDVLPPVTTQGLNTAGCLVNGEVWLPKAGGPFDPAIDCEYYPRVEGNDPRFWGILQLNLANNKTTKDATFIDIFFKSIYKAQAVPLVLNDTSQIRDKKGGGFSNSWRWTLPYHT